MTAVRGPGSGLRGAGAAPERRAVPAACFLVAFWLAVPVFGHGCHRSDHDDEPAFAPPPPKAKEPEPRPPGANRAVPGGPA